jgi:ATP-dependent DNA helicase RecG
MAILESSTVEVKREVTPELNKSVIAFANTNGGSIYVGINDEGIAIGVSDPDDAMLRIINNIRNTIKPDVTMFVDYRLEFIENKPIIKISVQKGTSCPYYLASEGMRPEGVYVRQGVASAPATETAILHMIRETDGERYEDIRSLNHDLTFEVAADSFAQHGIPFAVPQMKSLKLLNNNEIYTNLALLLSDQCPHTVKLAVFAGDVKEVFIDRQEFDGSLLKQLNEVYAQLNRYNRTRSVIDGLQRRDSRDYPPDTIREVLLNALIHRDYSYSDSTLLSVFENRIEVVSLGGLVRGISYDDIMLGVSVLRNKNLANVFYRLKLIEAYGTGVPKIMRSYEAYDTKPQILVSENAFKVILPSINENSKRTPLTMNEQLVLELVLQSRVISRGEVESKLNLSQSYVVRLLRGLVNKGELKIVGSGKNTRYTLP